MRAALCLVKIQLTLLAVSTFGKFPEETMLNLHTRILTHIAMAGQSSSQRRGSNHSPPRMNGRGNGSDHDAQRRMDGMDHEDGDTLASEPQRRGGLVRSGDSIAFKTPQGARPSLLGLDKLAAEKRAQAATAGHPSKRVKLEVEEDENGASSSGGVFKGASISHMEASLIFSSICSCQARSCAASTGRDAQSWWRLVGRGEKTIG